MPEVTVFDRPGRVLLAQFWSDGHVPALYWSAVVLISVVGTLLTDNLTDARGVPLWISSTVFAVLLAVVFSAWYAHERTLSIHSITTTPREGWYWLVVLVTFTYALGTAVGDWTLELTGWSPGASILLPAGLILAVLLAGRVGMGPVLSFWLAYILTRPLGANIGDFLASPHRAGVWDSPRCGRAWCSWRPSSTSPSPGWTGPRTCCKTRTRTRTRSPADVRDICLW